MNRFRPIAALLAVLMVGLPSGVAVGDDLPVVWSTSKDGRGDLREGRFEVADAACAYRMMAEPDRLVAALEHLREIRVHEDRGTWQDATFVEHFFLVGKVESRYHRTLEPAARRVGWRLVEGRQARHDGTWTVTPGAGGRGRIEFTNVIEAKSALHQGIVRSVQNKTMPDIVAATLLTCGR